MSEQARERETGARSRSLIYVYTSCMRKKKKRSRKEGREGNGDWTGRDERQNDRRIRSCACIVRIGAYTCVSSTSRTNILFTTWHVFGLVYL